MENKSINIKNGCILNYVETNEKNLVNVNYNNYKFRYENTDYTISYINSCQYYALAEYVGNNFCCFPNVYSRYSNGVW